MEMKQKFKLFLKVSFQVGLLWCFCSLVCDGRLKRGWQSCSPLSLGFHCGPRKSAGETGQSRWSPGAAAPQGSSARTRTLECRQHSSTAWTFTCSDINRQSDSCWSEQIINQDIDQCEQWKQPLKSLHGCYFLTRGDGQSGALGNAVILHDTDMSRMWEANQRFPVISCPRQIPAGHDWLEAERLMVIYTLVNWKPLCLHKVLWKQRNPNHWSGQIK